MVFFSELRAGVHFCNRKSGHGACEGHCAGCCLRNWTGGLKQPFEENMKWEIHKGYVTNNMDNIRTHGCV